MRRILLGLAVVLGLGAFPSSGWAQANNGGLFSDPFFFYYGFYLPRQQALSNQRGPELVINSNAAVRQQKRPLSLPPQAISRREARVVGGLSALPTIPARFNRWEAVVFSGRLQVTGEVSR